MSLHPSSTPSLGNRYCNNTNHGPPVVKNISRAKDTRNPYLDEDAFATQSSRPRVKNTFIHRGLPASPKNPVRTPLCTVRIVYAIAPCLESHNGTQRSSVHPSENGFRKRNHQEPTPAGLSFNGTVNEHSPLLMPEKKHDRVFPPFVPSLNLGNGPRPNRVHRTSFKPLRQKLPEGAQYASSRHDALVYFLDPVEAQVELTKVIEQLWTFVHPVEANLRHWKSTINADIKRVTALSNRSHCLSTEEVNKFRWELLTLLS